MNKEQIKRKAKTYSKNYWYNTNNSVNLASIEKLLIDFATEITKELEEFEEINIDLKQSLDWVNERGSEDVKRIGNLLTKAKELLTRFVMASVYFNGKEIDLVEEAEQFLKE